jgi:hypothetical protein
MTPLSGARYPKGGLAVLILLTWATVLGVGDAQEIAIQNEAGATVKVTAAEVAALPHQKVSVDDHGKTFRLPVSSPVIRPDAWPQGAPKQWRTSSYP